MKPRTQQDTAPKAPEAAKRAAQARRAKFDSNQASGSRNAAENAQRHPPKQGLRQISNFLRKLKRGKNRHATRN